MQFEAFPKIPRLSRDIVITEKLDGTNAQIRIEYLPPPSEGEEPAEHPNRLAYWYGSDGSMWGMWAGSRSRWITPASDNFGFARWALANVEALKRLGPGQHFGEWWGQGIQCGYGLTEKRFSLFNTGRWNADNIPSCCSVVPVLYKGPYSEAAINKALHDLAETGSAAAPGFMRPEGIIIFHTASGQMFKKTILNDESPKGQQV